MREGDQGDGGRKGAEKKHPLSRSPSPSPSQIHTHPPSLSPLLPLSPQRRHARPQTVLLLRLHLLLRRCRARAAALDARGHAAGQPLPPASAAAGPRDDARELLRASELSRLSGVAVAAGAALAALCEEAPRTVTAAMEGVAERPSSSSSSSSSAAAASYSTAAAATAGGAPALARMLGAFRTQQR